MILLLFPFVYCVEFDYWNILIIFSQYSHNILIILSQYSHNILTLFLQYYYNILTIFSQYFHNMLTICSQYAHNMLTIFSQYWVIVNLNSSLLCKAYERRMGFVIALEQQNNDNDNITLTQICSYAHWRRLLLTLIYAYSLIFTQVCQVKVLCDNFSFNSFLPPNYYYNLDNSYILIMTCQYWLISHMEAHLAW